MGLMNIVAHELKSHGVRMFSAKEMAFNILGLMHPLLINSGRTNLGRSEWWHGSPS